MIEYILTPQLVEALGWTLLHSLWQGAVFAILLVLILIGLRSYSAQSRYVVSVGLLCAFFLTLSATGYIQWQQANNRMEMNAAQLNQQSTTDAIPFNKTNENALLSDAEIINSAPIHEEFLEGGSSTWLVEFRNYFERHLPLLVTIWFLGILFLQLRFLGQLAYVQRLKHHGAKLFPTTWNDKIEELEGKLRIRKNVSYLTSIRIESPMVIGWLKPVILMPQQLFNSLTETEIYSILAHELAHIRREDFIVNLLQTFLCNLFFFHPGIWWMSNRIDDEREHCCDDLAIAATGHATSYAKTLINVSEHQWNMQTTPLAMALSLNNKERKRNGFSARIERLFLSNNGAGTFREGFTTAMILITALFLCIIATGSTMKNTETSISSDDIKSQFNSEHKQSNNSPLAIDNTMSNSKTKDLPISNVRQVVDQTQLPVADPVEVVQSNETRVDALVKACKEGDADFVATLVNLGVNINGIGSRGFTPLMMAVNHDEAAIVAYLLSQGADVNTTHNGWNALIEAADEGSLTSMKLLLKAGADVNFYAGHENLTAITMAASEGKLDCLKLLLENGADINGVGQSLPPLHVAAEEGKIDIVAYLISKNANIDKKDAAGRTALMYAAEEGKKNAVMLLINSGSDISILDFEGFAASDYAEKEDQYKIRDYINSQSAQSINKNDNPFLTRNQKNAEKRPQIHQATADGLIEKVARMVEQGADVNTIDDYGRTSLHIASALNHNIDMRVLIDLGADINAQDKQGRTPLMYAAADGKGDAVALLVSKEANVQLEDVDGMRAYEWGLSGGNADLAKFLGLITNDKKQIEKSKIKAQEKFSQKEIEKPVQKETKLKESFHIAANGTHLRQYDIKKKTPELLDVARHGSIEDCAKLLKNGMSVNATDDTGQTALMVAARTNRHDIAQYLIENGADVNMSSASGVTALHYAALENGVQMAQLLLRNNAKVDATMQYSSTDGNFDRKPLVWVYTGATPLLIAVESGNTKVVSVLINAGANTRHKLIRKEYRLNKNRANYLTGSEVMGFDEGFLKEVEFQTVDEAWTPYKQALLLNDPEVIALFKN